MASNHSDIQGLLQKRIDDAKALLDDLDEVTGRLMELQRETNKDQSEPELRYTRRKAAAKTIADEARNKRRNNPKYGDKWNPSPVIIPASELQALEHTSTQLGRRTFFMNLKHGTNGRGICPITYIYQRGHP